MNLRTGVLRGDEVQHVFAIAKQHKFALPAVNVAGANTINAALEAAREANSPIIIEFSHSGALFAGGKGLPNDNYEGSVAGGIAGARHIHNLAKHYGVSVIVHTDHAPRAKLPWIDGLMIENQRHMERYGQPLYSMHMLDLSEEDLHANVATCCEYLKQMAPLGITLEIELGVTGGEEDGVDNTGIDSARLYTQPQDVAYAYEQLSVISDRFTIAAAFGNVHGVYKPGNVHLQPIILKNCQDHVVQKHNTAAKPLSFVFHGGSGSSREDIREAIDYGVVKMNIDTDTQWAFWRGVRDYVAEHHDYLQTQIGNPEGDDKPNKKKYDPRKRLRAGEKSMTKRLLEAFADLNSIGSNKHFS